MNGEKNKPLDSSQLHQVNSIEVTVRKQPASIDKDHIDDSQPPENTATIKVSNHNAVPSPEPVSVDDAETNIIEPDTYQPEADTAEYLKVDDKFEPEVPPVAEPEVQTTPEPVTATTISSNSTPDNFDQPIAKTSTEELPANTPGVLVLQWLTYAFWGWTCLAMIWLTYVVSAHLIGGDQSSSGMSAYILAAVLVLLPLSIGCDWFYSRKEPSKKTGASMVLMILHAVLFALLAIGSLIIFMYSLVQYMLVTPGDMTDTYIMMSTSITVAVIYLVVFLRTLNPLPKKKPGLILSIFMFVAIAILVTINLTGPIKTQKAIQQDNQTTEQLMSLVSDLNQHAKINNDLPASLSNSSFKGKDNPLVVSNAVEYTRYDPVPSDQSTEEADSSPDYDKPNSSYDGLNHTKLPFKLCVTYKVDTSYDYNQPLTIAQPSDSFYADQAHKDGKNCYELYAFASSSH